jgi:hypothetical protein
MQTVAEHQNKNMMMEDNLATVFGPTILGNSTPVLENEVAFKETISQKAVVNALLKIGSDYWSTFMGPSENSIFSYLSPADNRIFAPLPTYSPNLVVPMSAPRTGGIAKRTRSKQHGLRRPLFESPMIN